MTKRTSVYIDPLILERFTEADWPHASQNRIRYRTDLKPPTKEDVALVLSWNPEAVVCNPRQAVRIQEFVAKLNSNIPVQIARCVSPCELSGMWFMSPIEIEAAEEHERSLAAQARRWMAEARSVVKYDTTGEIIEGSRRTPARDTLPIYANDIKKIMMEHRDEWNDDTRQVVKWYKKERKLFLAKGQIDRLLSGTMSRVYIRAKIIKQN